MGPLIGPRRSFRSDGHIAVRVNPVVALSRCGLRHVERNARQALSASSPMLVSSRAALTRIFL